MRRLVCSLPALLAASIAAAQAPAAVTPCADDPRYSRLDFWVGAWDVFIDGELAGHNRIEKILDGCAVLEHWTGSGGGQGKSLFYVGPGGRWQQVWVTVAATRPGGTKEKAERPAPDDGGMRFEGRIEGRDGTTWLDRTTLTPLPDGSVRQLIEVSMDGGESWRATFDAVYRRKP